MTRAEQEALEKFMAAINALPDEDDVEESDALPPKPTKDKR